MEPTGLGPAVVDPLWLAVMVAIAILGSAATAFMLLRQMTPRARLDPERIARWREGARAIAH